MSMDGYYEIKSNERIAQDVYRMVLLGDTGNIRMPGQFINIKLPNYYLRRPISVCDWDDESITIIYKIMGEGTREMSGFHEGTLQILTGLGNGFNPFREKEHAVLIGGGVGVPPLYGLAKFLMKKGVKVDVALGFNTADDVFYEQEFQALGAEVTIATADGSYGMKGFATDAVLERGLTNTYFFTCGPMGMLRAVDALMEAPGQLSLEARMGCGFGACMGCSIETANGPKRVCKEGPVFLKEELLW